MALSGHKHWRPAPAALMPFNTGVSTPTWMAAAAPKQLAAAAAPKPTCAAASCLAPNRKRAAQEDVTCNGSKRARLAPRATTPADIPARWQAVLAAAEVAAAAETRTRTEAPARPSCCASFPATYPTSSSSAASAFSLPPPFDIPASCTSNGTFAAAPSTRQVFPTLTPRQCSLQAAQLSPALTPQQISLLATDPWTLGWAAALLPYLNTPLASPTRDSRCGTGSGSTTPSLSPVAATPGRQEERRAPTDRRAQLFERGMSMILAEMGSQEAAELAAARSFLSLF